MALANANATDLMDRLDELLEDHAQDLRPQIPRLELLLSALRRQTEMVRVGDGQCAGPKTVVGGRSGGRGHNRGRRPRCAVNLDEFSRKQQFHSTNTPIHPPA